MTQVRLAWREVEFVLDRGQGDVHDRRVEDDHQLREADHDEAHPAAAVGGVGVMESVFMGEFPTVVACKAGAKMEASSRTKWRLPPELYGGYLRFSRDSTK